jgi:hypothetical protein
MKESEHLAAIETTTSRYNEAIAALEQARKEAADAVVAALRDKVPPTTVTEKSPFTATYVRQLARGAGIPAATTRRRPQRRSAP